MLPIYFWQKSLKRICDSYLQNNVIDHMKLHEDDNDVRLEELETYYPFRLMIIVCNFFGLRYFQTILKVFAIFIKHLVLIFC